jgi:hypothetical protein
MFYTWEILTLITALALEGWGITNPYVNPATLNWFKKLAPLRLIVALYMLLAGLSYYVFTFIWLFDEEIIIQRCALVIVLLSIVAITKKILKKQPITLKIIDHCLSFICLSIILYIRIMWR